MLATIDAQRIENRRRILGRRDAAGLLAVERAQGIAIDATPAIRAQGFLARFKKGQKLFTILRPAFRIAEGINLQTEFSQTHRTKKVIEQQQDIRVDKRIATPQRFGADLMKLAHDFLWRTARALPERGRIGIFNRSHYEEVLIVRVHSELLRAEGLPDEALDDKTIWRDRYRSIRHFEAHLHRNGTRIVKFFLHLSKDEQRKRFLARLEEPDKNWKFSRADVEERKYWDDYMDAYEACLNATSMRDSPWYVVPADDKGNARLIISRIILDTLRGLKVKYPTISEKQRKELGALRRLLAK